MRVDPLFLAVAGHAQAVDHARLVLGADDSHLGLVDPRGHDGTQQLDLLVADGGGVHRRRRLHHREGEDLHDMVLDDVAQCPGTLVERPPVLDAQGLGDGDVHMADVATVPDRLEDGVGEAEREHVLHGLFAHVMVDPVDLVLVEAGVKRLVEGHGRLEVSAEGLLDHEAGEAAPRPGLVQAMATEPQGDLPEERRDGGEVVDPVAGRSAACTLGRVELGERLGHLREGGVVVVVARHVAEPPHELGPDGLCVGHGLDAVVPEFVVGPCGPGDADQTEAVGERSLTCQGGKSGQELSRREVAGGAEHDEGDGRDLALGALGGHEDS